jgi:hypothetical protein
MVKQCPLSLVQDTIKNHFFTQNCLRRVVAFTDSGIQHEGWFNGEIVYLFGSMKKGEGIKSWSRECPSTIAGRCDFKLELVNATTVVFEMKALQQRDQRGLWRLGHSAVDIVDHNDISKMLGIAATDRYLVVFAYPVRAANEWDELATKVQQFLVSKKGIHNAISVSRFDDSPGGELSIGWLQLH